MKWVKKILEYSVVVLLIISSGGYALTLSPPQEIKGTVTKEVVVPIHLTKMKDLGSMQFDLSYRSDILALKEVKPEEKISGILLDFHESTPGKLKIAFAANEGITGDSKIDLLFTIQKEGTTDIKIDNVKAWDYTNGADLLVSANSGKLIASTGLGFPMWWLAVGGGIVIIILLLFLFMRKKTDK